MAAALRRTLSGFEPNAQISVQNLSDSLDGELFPARAAASALGVMGLLAAMLAVTAPGVIARPAWSSE